MHLKKFELQIQQDEEEQYTSGVSSGFNPNPIPQISTNSFQHPILFPIQIPPNSTQNHLHHDQPSKIYSQTILSAPHKRPLMAQLPSRISSVHHYQGSNLSSDPPSSSFACLPSLNLGNKSLGLTCLPRVHFRFLFLLALPLLYFLVSNPRRSFLIDFLSVVAFSAALLFSLNLALPRFPSIRFFFSRSFPNKFGSSFSSSKLPEPVVWSIGSNPKSHKPPNSGSSVQVYRNGDAYEGEFHKGKCSGSGVYYYYMSGRYEGEWIDEKYDGYGVETWARGSRYRGQYRQGLRHGIGVYRFYTGDVYAGEWSNGQSHGCGIHICEDGSRYVGQFKWGVKHGLGHYSFRNGDTYAGEYFADKMHGFGIYHFGNGHQYEGAWHEGKRQGLGMYSFRNGQTQSGHWENGVLDVRSTENTHLNSPHAVNHHRVLNAVQEAQGAAEKASQLAKVEERVNKAVAAANKAAYAARVAAVKAVQEKMHHPNNDDLTFLILD